MRTRLTDYGRYVIGLHTMVVVLCLGGELRNATAALVLAAWYGLLVARFLIAIGRCLATPDQYVLLTEATEDELRAELARREVVTR